MEEKPAIRVDELVGRRLRNYELIEVAGRGGMGVVYRALDTRLERTVAIKLMDQEKMVSLRFQRRFQKEARSASAINHPNVAHVYEIGEENGAWFIAMEFVEGKSLDSKLQTGKLEESQVVEIGLQLLEALKAAHAKGIIHRDIKPSNIVITSEGYVKVLDFGLARWEKEEGNDEEGVPTITASGVIIGSVPYMSPE